MIETNALFRDQKRKLPSIWFQKSDAQLQPQMFSAAATSCISRLIDRTSFRKTSVAVDNSYA